MLYVLLAFAVVFGWFAVNFFIAPLIDIFIARRQIHQELMFSSSKIPYQPLFHEDKQKAFEDSQQRIRQLGALCNKLHRRLYQPLPFVLRRIGYDLGAAGRNLLRLSTQLKHDERLRTRYCVEAALRLPHLEESMTPVEKLSHDCVAAALSVIKSEPAPRPPALQSSDELNDGNGSRARQVETVVSGRNSPH